MRGSRGSWGSRGSRVTPGRLHTLPSGRAAPICASARPLTPRPSRPRPAAATSLRAPCPSCRPPSPSSTFPSTSTQVRRARAPPLHAALCMPRCTAPPAASPAAQQRQQPTRPLHPGSRRQTLRPSRPPAHHAHPPPPTRRRRAQAARGGALVWRRGEPAGRQHRPAGRVAGLLRLPVQQQAHRLHPPLCDQEHVPVRAGPLLQQAGRCAGGCCGGAAAAAGAAAARLFWSCRAAAACVCGAAGLQCCVGPQGCGLRAAAPARGICVGAGRNALRRAEGRASRTARKHEPAAAAHRTPPCPLPTCRPAGVVPDDWVEGALSSLDLSNNGFKGGRPAAHTRRALRCRCCIAALGRMLVWRRARRLPRQGRPPAAHPRPARDALLRPAAAPSRPRRRAAALAGRHHQPHPPRPVG